MLLCETPYSADVPRISGLVKFEEKDFDVIVAGRCASATHLGFASGRGMGECLGMGQAAGVAAAESIRQKVLPRNVDVKKVQEILRSWGVKL